MRNIQNFAGLLGIVAAMAGAVALGAEGFVFWELAAIATLLLGGVAALVATQPKLKVMILRVDEGGCRLERAQERDVPVIHTIATEVFGDRVTPQSQIRGFIKRNKDVFWVLLASRPGSTSITVEGYLCLLPMSEEMMRKADAHEFDVTLVHPTHVPRPSEVACAIYIGAVVGRTARAKGQALGHLLEKAERLARATKSRSVYARAASKDGLRLIEKHQFDPVLEGRRGIGMLYRRAYAA